MLQTRFNETFRNCMIDIESELLCNSLWKLCVDTVTGTFPEWIIIGDCKEKQSINQKENQMAQDKPLFWKPLRVHVLGTVTQGRA